jgi:ketosteroid isomerase-like protein
MVARTTVFLLGIFVFSATFSAGQEPVRTPAGPRIITATRQVTLFSGLELQLLQAVQKKDKPALQSLLADDFMIFMPDSEPLPVDDWLDVVTSADYSMKSFAVRHFYASDLGDSVLIIFERSQSATWKGKADNGQFFVADLWKKSGDGWKLATRSVAKTSSIPAAAKTVRKPSGKQ